MDALGGGAADLWRVVLGALLYAFLLQFFWLLRRDLARAQTGAAGTSIGLTVVEAPDELASALDAPADPSGGAETNVACAVGQTFQLPSPATLGRAPGNTLVVPAETVSLSHLRLVYRNRVWWVEDLGSTNGTFVNGDRIGAITRLSAGASLGCGPQVRFRLHDLS